MRREIIDALDAVGDWLCQVLQDVFVFLLIGLILLAAVVYGIELHQDAVYRQTRPPIELHRGTR